MNRFMDTVLQTRFDGTYLKWIKGIANQKLLILDDFGLKSIDVDTRLTILDILEDKYGNSSVVITSQLPIEPWYNFIDEPTLAEAVNLSSRCKYVSYRCITELYKIHTRKMDSSKCGKIFQRQRSVSVRLSAQSVRGRQIIVKA